MGRGRTAMGAIKRIAQKTIKNYEKKGLKVLINDFGILQKIRGVYTVVYLH